MKIVRFSIFITLLILTVIAIAIFKSGHAFLLVVGILCIGPAAFASSIYNAVHKVLTKWKGEEDVNEELDTMSK